jgi:hypothetical protein
VSAVSSNDVWAVGDTLPGGGDRQTLVEHWNGSSWAVVRSPNKGTYDGLHRVLGVSTKDVWAAGTAYDSATNKTDALLEHWDGTRWSIATNPSLRDSDYVRGISGSSTSDVWIVGEADDPAPNYTAHTLIEHWNGSTWAVMTDPDVGSISGISAVSPTDAWIVGVKYVGSTGVTLIEHWNGSTWRVVSSPNGSSASGAFNSLNAATRVPGTSTTVWAVGSYYGVGNDGGTLTLRNLQG